MNQKRKKQKRLKNKQNDETIENEGFIKGQSSSISIDNFKLFEKQSEFIFKIDKEDSSGTGFFCFIPFPDKLTQKPVLFTCNHVLSENDILQGKEIKLLFNNSKIYTLKIDNNRMVYTSPENEYDTTIIEIKEEDGFDINYFLEIDYDIFKENKTKEIFKEKSIYIIHFPQN